LPFTVVPFRRSPTVSKIVERSAFDPVR